MNPDLAVSIRAALLADSDIADQLADYLGSKAVFTREPAPAQAVYPMIVVSRNTGTDNEDGLNDFRPKVVHNITVHGSHELPDNFRVVSDLGYRIRNLFHDQKNATAVGWDTVRQVCNGPVDLPTTGPTTARTVALTVLLAQLVDFVPSVDEPDHLLMADGSGAILSTEGDVITIAGL